MTKNPNPEFELKIFENVKQEIKKKYAHLKPIIQRKEEALKSQPYAVSEPLAHNLVGLRSIKLKKNFLMLIAICEECRRQGMQAFNNCDGCEDISDKSVVVF